MPRGIANKGKKRTEEQKQRIRDAQNKRYENPDERKKMADAQNKRYEDPIERMKHSRPGSLNPNFGKPMSDDQKKQISEVQTGRIKSEEERKKISDAHKGKHFSEEHKRKIGLAHLGRKHTEQHRENNGKAQTGKKATPEKLMKMSIAFTGSNNPAWVGGNRKGYCPDKWTTEFRRRIRLFFGNVCVECGTPQNGELLHCHHVYYNKKACCEISPDGKYYSNLGIVGESNTFEIVGDPNKFVPLCQRCHAITSHKKNRIMYAQKYEKLVNEQYGGRSYLTKEELGELNSHSNVFTGSHHGST